MMTTIQQNDHLPSDSYVPQHDEAEVSRLKEFYAQSGLGSMMVEDDELRDVLSDFGVQINSQLGKNE